MTSVVGIIYRAKDVAYIGKSDLGINPCNDRRM